jgi:Asp-tRNA(Asn)/Glu-tRNA(Gln) amidotransferase A subunit family amidase
MTDAERRIAAGSWRTSMAPLLERRIGPRKVALDPTVAPATQWTPWRLDARASAEATNARDRFVRAAADPGPLPSSDSDIAYAPVHQLSRWIETKKLTSQRLTAIYLDRIQRYDGKLRSVITTTRDAALAQAKQADSEIAAGKYRGPLHGIPYGVKDLLDTAGIPTTYGAEPFRNRIPSADSVVVARLHQAGAVLLAKLSMGALALNDIWFGGQTMNPWLLDEGSSGSSAGPGAATAAALEAAKKTGMVLQEVSLPDWPYDSLNIILFAEAAAAFEELTLSGQDDQLKVQVPDAWPNLFRESRFLSAVDFVQTDRFRRNVAAEMARIFSTVDLLLVPSLRDEMLVISNFTGHPSLTLRAGFVSVGEARSDWAPDPAKPLPKFPTPRRVPHGVTLVGRLFDEGTIARAGLALERAFGVAGERPPEFA